MGAFTVKPIRPEKLDVKAIRLEINKVLQAEGRTQVKELKKTVKSWRRKVGFAYDVDLSGRDASVLTGPATGNVKVWNMLEEGTPRHPITPRQAKRLRFQGGKYRAKTRPWHLGSKSGGATGKHVYARAVMHPGTQAREWLPTLVSKRRKPFARSVNAAVRRGANKLYKGRR